MINRRLKLIINKGGVNMGLFSELFSNIVSDILINSYISAINYEEDENSFDENNINEDFGLSEEDTKYFQQRMLKGMENIRKTQEMRRDQLEYAMKKIDDGDVETGLAEIRDLSRLNYGLAQYALGYFYLNGKYVEKDYFYALYFLTQADKKNVLCATELLANCFENGIGVAANPERAKILRKKIKELEELNNQI